MKRVLRIDDIGASSKKYARHVGKWFAYREIHAEELDVLCLWLQRTGNRATLAITAAWVERNGSLTRYDVKFPAQTAAIRRMLDKGLVEIACHGLTHCVPGKHLPTWWPLRGNRKWHREFTDLMPTQQQMTHLVRAKSWLEMMFDADVTTLVPPGYAISPGMAHYARKLGFYVEGRRAEPHVVMHDWDLIGFGDGKVKPALERLTGAFTTVREATR